MQRLFFFLLLLLMKAAGFAQPLPGSVAEQLQARIERYHELFPQEKAFLHVDKDTYLLGDNLWFQAYLVDASLHVPNGLSTVLYVELLGPADQILASHPIQLKAGVGKGDFEIDRRWTPGTYLLRAYTQYMRNYDPSLIFSQEIRIENPYLSFLDLGNEEQGKKSQAMNSKFAVQFFPEGGELVEGLVSILGVKATDENGRGIVSQGVIRDRQGKEIARFQTGKFGLGSFPFRAEPGQKYRAEVDFQGQTEEFKLPKALTEGYVMQASEIPSGELSITLQSNHPDGLTGGVLLGHLRGQVFANLDQLQGNAMRFRLPLADIPSGIAHFTLFSPKGLPVAERLVFLNHRENEPSLRIKSEQQQYGIREKITLQASLIQASGEATSGQVSASVSERMFTNGPKASQNIRSYLLLSSDLKGRIEDPDYFFEDDSPERKRLLDQLMLTHGWRRFVWQDLLKDQDPYIRFYNEQGFTFSGSTTRPDMEKRNLQAEVFLSSLDTRNFFMDETITTEDGRFVFAGYHFTDTTDILLQANRYHPLKEKKRKRKKPEPDVGPDGNQNIDILLDRPGKPVVERNWAFSPFLFPSQLNAEIEEDLNWKQALQQEYLKYKEYELEEIVIQGRRNKQTDPYQRPGMLYGTPSQRVILDSLKGGSLSQTVFQIIRGRVPGVEIVGTPGINQTARIRGNNSISLGTTAMILLDGVPINAESANTINIQNVEFIDVIKGLSAASVYGGMSANGIIAIYTRQGGSQATFAAKVHRGVINIRHPGYYKSRSFYAPVYQGANASSQSLDFRTTLYWKPEVVIGSDGKVQFEFFSGDRESTYEVRIEGMSSDGNPVSATYEIEVRE